MQNMHDEYIKDTHMLPEQQIWAAAIVTYVADAIKPFTIPGNGNNPRTIEQQFNDYKSGKKKIPAIYDTRTHEKAKIWLCSSQFDSFAFMCGHDSRFVNRVFKFVKDVLKMREELKVLYEKRRLEKIGMTTITKRQQEVVNRKNRLAKEKFMVDWTIASKVFR